MNAKTRKALKESIAHWKRHATGKSYMDERVHSEDCALCALFLESRCDGCPVKKKTGLHLCQGTPWESAAYAFAAFGVESRQFRAAARKMLAFLRRLKGAR